MGETTILDQLLTEAFERGFANFARECPHRIIDNRGGGVCNFHESAPGDCSLALCPRVKAKLRNGDQKNEY